ncbi:hypothetical protein RJ639_037141 [Escallonia herrerae]|uniref:CHD3-type chromatin-remodeling factor PICKLE n=1 Tax=Escallonia herrerae TaxID=1293975 RepID=A0AA88WSB5_9ASTE|nr:hypothetical protein RJ639_037141 [Escallonia herrerae]
MTSLVERLRVRSDRRPVYNLDDSDDDADLLRGKSGNNQQKFEKIVRSDAKDDSCQACGGSGNLLCCETCTYAYHPKCLLPPLKAPLPTSWSCPECVSPLNDIDKILDCEMRPTAADESDASKLGSKQIFVRQYLVKWKGLSYLHCTWVKYVFSRVAWLAFVRDFHVCIFEFIEALNGVTLPAIYHPRVPEKEFVKAYKAHPRLRMKVNNFQRQMSSANNTEDDFVAIRPEWTTVDRILACRHRLAADFCAGAEMDSASFRDKSDTDANGRKVIGGKKRGQATERSKMKRVFYLIEVGLKALKTRGDGKWDLRGEDEEKEYFVKWKELPYDECYWEFESDISSFQPEIEKFNRIQSRSGKLAKQKSSLRDPTELKKKQKDFQQYEKSPEFLTGGSLHPYQLEGLNFLRFSWPKQTHVILADEMGLGKTIQSIAFLASLFEENISPHLVVAPLSTLRNWEREFATWAPQMNVVMYVGSSQARAVIREYEFYFPKSYTKNKKKKSSHIVGESKQERIKFDVLLTSYEMINLDSASLKPIKWQCMIVDEGHRLKNKDSKLFLSLTQYSSRHRVLLTGTPLQNNLDELFMLMHFLDAGKFGSLEEFQEEFKDINQEEQILRLHKMLAPHLLRMLPDSLETLAYSELGLASLNAVNSHTGTPKPANCLHIYHGWGLLKGSSELVSTLNAPCQEMQSFVLGFDPRAKCLIGHFGCRLGVKKDVMKELPPKKELILRVELSSKQKEYYKAILTRNYQLLTRRGGAQISLINVVMELRKLCCHPFMLEGVEPEDTNEFTKQLLESSGKLHLLDKMMLKLKEQGHRVLIYSQFQHMLDLLEDYCNYRKWQYERIDGKVGGAERQIRIDRFNAKNSSRFCFLLSTRAGGLGINLATADTVIIYDSDWNPHADLQAMARAHRLGQTNKVMIFRLITRGTIEERMMQMTKKKMVLEHLVVGRLKAQNINQEELDDIIRYGSKELFADENDEAGKSRQIHYDDAAIDRLLDRDQVGVEEATLEDEEEDGFLKAFKVANFEYIDEVEAGVEEEAQVPPMENKATVNNPERASYWEELLKDRYEVHKIEEFNAMGKGKRSRKQMVSVEEDDLAGLEDVSSDGEDDNYEAELTDGETASAEAPPVRKPSRKKPRVDSSEPLPLMEGEGRSFRVLGFSQNQRAAFVQILMRFGVGEFDWAEFTPRLKQKTFEEIKDYGTLFLSHIAEDITDATTFSDGVPKEGLRIQDVLVRIAVLLLIRDKVKLSSEKVGAPLFEDNIISRFPGLKGGRFWKDHHDLLLLRAVLKHGYGRWQAIVDDKDLRVQEVICQELNLPFINLPAPGGSQAQVSVPGGSQAQIVAPGVSQTKIATPGGSQANDGADVCGPQTTGNQVKGTVSGNDLGANAAQGVADRPQLYQDSSVLNHFREMQRRQVEFIKRRVLLLEKALNAEYQKEFFGDEKSNETPGDEMETTESKIADKPGPSFVEIYSQMIDHLPQMQVISLEETVTAACDEKQDRLDMARLYNEMVKVLAENVNNFAEANLAKKPADHQLRKNLFPLEAIYREIGQILSLQNSSDLGCPTFKAGEPQSQVRGPNPPGIGQPILKADQQSKDSAPSEVDDHGTKDEVATEIFISSAESGPQTEARPELEKSNSACKTMVADPCSRQAEPSMSNLDVEMAEAQHDADTHVNPPADGRPEKPGDGVIILDD